MRRALNMMFSRGTTLESRSLKNFFAEATKPDFIIVSGGGPLPPIDLIELCIARRLPFVSVGQANVEEWWPEDGLADRYREALAGALRCSLVSEANRRLAEKQIGTELANAEVIRNPFNVSPDASPPFPRGGGGIKFACVGRLYPASEGAGSPARGLRPRP